LNGHISATAHSAHRAVIFAIAQPPCMNLRLFYAIRFTYLLTFCRYPLSDDDVDGSPSCRPTLSLSSVFDSRRTQSSAVGIGDDPEKIWEN